MTVRYRANKAFKAQLLNLPGTMQAVDACAVRILGRANSMFEASGYVMRKARPGKVRCHAYVATGDLHAMNSNARHMTLEKSLRG